MAHLDFLIVGAPKCGTTAMHAFLRGHPEIYLPERKELHYYGSDLNDLASQLTAEEHAALFQRADAEQCVGETCIWSLYSTRAASEIRREHPDAKIVIMLRDPAEMMYALHSEYLYQQMENVTDFRKALQLEAARRRGQHIPPTNTPKKLFFYRDIVKYAEQVERYLKCFPASQVHVILFDDLRQDLPGVYQKLLGFLNVAPNFRPEFGLINPNKRVRSLHIRRILKQRPPWARTLARSLIPMPGLRQRVRDSISRWNISYAPRRPLADSLRRDLVAELTPDIERLSQLLARDLGDWLRTSRYSRAA